MFYTLPVTDFRTLPDGEDVNIIDTGTIRSTVMDSWPEIARPQTPVGIRLHTVSRST